MGFPNFNIPDPLTAPRSGNNLLRTGLAWLTGQLKTNASEAIVYARGYDSVECRATLGSKLLKLDDGMGGFRMEWTDLDFLIPAADLNFDGFPVIPERGDLVHLTVAPMNPSFNDGMDNVQTFEVVPYGGTEAVWRWADPHQSMMRVHTKYIDTELYTPPAPVYPEPIFDTLATINGPNPPTYDFDKDGVTVLVDSAGVSHMWYGAAGGADDPDFVGMAYATSLDGIHWTRPDLGQVEYPSGSGNKHNNLQCPGLGNSGFGGWVVSDPNALSGQQYVQSLAILNGVGGLFITPSADGVTWAAPKIVYNGAFKTATGLAKRSDGRYAQFYQFAFGSNLRSIGMFTSDTTDVYGSWTDQGPCTGLTAVSNTAQFYTLNVFTQTSSAWYGCISRYDSTTGLVTIDLWFSSNEGSSWTILRPNWIPLGNPGTWNSKVIFSACVVPVPGDFLKYYSGGSQPHDVFPRASEIGLAAVPFP